MSYHSLCIYYDLLLIVMRILYAEIRNNLLVIMYNRINVYFVSLTFCADLSTKQLENNTDICEQLLRLADVLEPGITRFRGLLLYYLVRGLRQLKRKKHRRV